MTCTGRLMYRPSTWHVPFRASLIPAVTFQPIHSDRLMKVNMFVMRPTSHPFKIHNLYELDVVSLTLKCDLNTYHLSILAMRATFSVGVCSNVAQCDASVRFCFNIGSHVCIGAVIPYSTKNEINALKRSNANGIVNGIFERLPVPPYLE